METRHTKGQPRRSAGLLLDQYLSTGSSTEALPPISPLSRFRQQVARQRKILPPRTRTLVHASRTDFPLSKIWDAQHVLQHQTELKPSAMAQQQPAEIAPPRPHAKPVKPAILTPPPLKPVPQEETQAAIRMTRAVQCLQRCWRRFNSRRSGVRRTQRAFSAENASFRIVLDETARPPAVPKPTQTPASHHSGHSVVVVDQMKQQVAADHDSSGSSEFEAPSAVPFWVDDEWSELEEGRYVGKLSAPDQAIDPEELVGRSTTQFLQMSQRHQSVPLTMERDLDLATPTQGTDPIPEPEPNRSTPSWHHLAPSRSFRIALKGFRRRRTKMNALPRSSAQLHRKKTAQSGPLAAAIGSDEEAPGLCQNDTQTSTVSTEAEAVSTGSDPDTDHTYVVFSTPSIDGASQRILPRNDLISIQCALATSHSSQELDAFTRQPPPPSPSRAFFIASDPMELRPSPETSQMPLGLMGAIQQLLDETERAQDQAQPLATQHGQPFARKIRSAPSLQSLAGGYEPGLDDEDDEEEQEELLALGRDVVQTKQHEFLQVLQDFKRSFQRSKETPRSNPDLGPWSACTAAASGLEEEATDLELQAMLREIRQLSMGMGMFMFPPANPRRAIGLGNHAD